MPKVSSNAAAGPAVSRVFTPTNSTPRALYSECTAFSAGASTRHGGHDAYQTLISKGAPRSAVPSKSSPSLVVVRISRGSARPYGRISSTSHYPETLKTHTLLAGHKTSLHGP